MNIFTIGHSTHSLDEFIQMLQSFDIKLLVDVRSYPGSRYLPHFNKENLSAPLKKYGINYTHISSLGGRRRKSSDENNIIMAGWRHIAFRNYACHT